jgi:hypothetical protein
LRWETALEVRYLTDRERERKHVESAWMEGRQGALRVRETSGFSAEKL